VIALYGATGYTGELVAEELTARGLPFVIAGRSADALIKLAARLSSQPEWVAVAANDLHGLEALARRARVLINCAGPFVRTGLAPARAAIDSGAHYLDSTGELTFMMRVARELGDSAAGRGVAVLSGAAYEYALSDLFLPRSTAGFSRVDTLDVAYAVTASSSLGTRLSAIEIARGDWWVSRGGIVRQSLGLPAARTFDFGRGRATRTTSFPGGELVLAPVTIPGVREVRVFMAGLPGAVAMRALKVALHLPGGRALAKRAISGSPARPSAEARAASTFTIAHEVKGIRNGVASTSTLLIRGTDPYGLTAKLLVEQAERLAAGEVRRTGFTSPAATFDAAALQARLASWGVSAEERR
jgi:short subunit dehydrogenase-like uncharacterized protein